MKEDFILHEDIEEMINMCYQKLSVFDIPKRKKMVVTSAILFFLNSNKDSPGISVDSLYHATKLKCRETYKSIDLTKELFSWCLIFTINSPRFSLRDFKNSGWVILDLYGRTLENSYSTDVVF